MSVYTDEEKMRLANTVIKVLRNYGPHSLAMLKQTTQAETRVLKQVMKGLHESGLVDLNEDGIYSVVKPK